MTATEAVVLDERLTPEQLAIRWGMSVGTLANWRRSNKGPKFIRLGDGPKGRVLYRLMDVLTYENRKEPQ